MDNIAIPEGMARLNVTWNANNGDLQDPVPYDATDQELKHIVTESIQSGYIAGIPVDPNVDLTDFVVDRFAASAEVPYARCFVRPKTPFGG